MTHRGQGATFFGARWWWPGSLAAVMVACASSSAPEPQREPAEDEDVAPEEPEPTASCDCAIDAGPGACPSEACLPAGAFEPCEGHDQCAQGHYCLPTRDPAFHGLSICVPACETDTDCFTGCCGTLETGEDLCGFPADCRPVGVGDPCFSNDDCASEDCRWGSCVIPCADDDDCGTNLLGLENACYRETSEGGTVQSACLPGCRDDRDCRYYFEDPFYSYDPDRFRIPLECVEGTAGRYCL